MKRSYTLVEMIAAIAIFVIAAGAVAACAGAALKVFERARSYGSEHADLVVGLEKMERDLRNVFVLDGIGVEGSSSRVSVPSIVRINSAGQTADALPGQVTYFFDPLTKTLRVAYADYARALQTQEVARREARTLAENIQDVTFSYWWFDVENESFAWRDAWEKEDGIPLAIRFELTFGGGDRPLRFTRIVFVPIAGEQRFAAGG
ncbi:MAG: prepilin-type N-terminal cleavage/methylation domain-containing protein [Candidatus Pacebacteria bacterium]|nr:prepilin-type N-terminal cleavage/methylation domain-containing protein [Candidatus Paceibacterota bacterium]